MKNIECQITFKLLQLMRILKVKVIPAERDVFGQIQVFIDSSSLNRMPSGQVATGGQAARTSLAAAHSHS